MPRKTYRPEEIILSLRQAEVLIGQGKNTSMGGSTSPAASDKFALHIASS